MSRHPSISSWRPAWLALGVLLLLPRVAPGQETATGRMAQLYHQAWGLREGAPGSITSIAQTTDGYLWLANPSGLFRFDGVRFERIDPPAGGTRLNPGQLAATPDGALWITHRGAGISRLRDGRFTSYGDADDVPAGQLTSLAVDRSGGLWVASLAGVVRFSGERWQRVGAEFGVPAQNGALFVDRDNVVWIAAGDQVFVLPPGAERARVTGIKGRIRGFAQHPDGTVWATGPNGLRWFVTPGGAATLAGPFNAQARPLFFDRSGALWRANTEGGINRTVLASGSSDGPAPTDDWLGALDGLTADDVFDIFQDREANIWVGTGGGLDLLRATALVAAPLPRNAHGSRVAADTDGAVWIGGENLELTRLHHGATSTFGVPAPIWALHRDSSGEVWVWSTGRLWRGVGGVFSRMPPAPFTGEPSAMARDRLGRLWVGVTNSGLFTFSEGRWSRATIPGLPATSGPLRVAESDSAGSAWMLFRNGTIARIAGDQITIDAGAAALGRGLAAAFAPSADRTWIGLDRGLVVVDRLGARAIAGLTESTIGRIKGVVEAANGSVWLNADRGVVQIEPAEVQRMLSVPSVAPRFRVLDYLDGGIGGAVLVPSQAAASGTDGRLWFVGFDSVVTIDPTQIPSNPLPPPVHIQTLTVAGHAYPVSDGLPLPVGTTNIQIKYTALSLTMPDRVRFRYVLEGVDGGWQEAGGRREAFYTNLSPGSYTFRVVASNNDGVWNETGATLAFEVPPAFYQTAAFRAGSVFLVLGLVWLAYRLRLRQVTGQVRDRLEERRSERERIARELHDTLLQGLQGLILKFQAIATRLPPGDATAAAIERALERADRVLIESRDRVRDLRVSTESGAELSAALAAVADELARDTTLTFQVAAEGEPRPLHPIVRDEAYWIGREALVNAFHHSKGRCVEAEVCYAASELRLRCRDDGTGIGRDALDGQSDGRWGVRGMRERARRIGASLEIRSRPNAGTEVELRVPAAAAYPGMSRSWWPRLRRVAAGGGVS